jgi:hypothetical protein
MCASFALMYCPENPEVKARWEQAWPFFGEKDYGFMMENYGHGGITHADSGQALGGGKTLSGHERKT